MPAILSTRACRNGITIPEADGRIVIIWLSDDGCNHEPHNRGFIFSATRFGNETFVSLGNLVNYEQQRPDVLSPGSLLKVFASPLRADERPERQGPCCVKLSGTSA